MGNHVFGPVPSRRLGRSLGVDLVPLKTCTYDCIYCQLGRTTYKTMDRREWFPLSDILEELEAKLPSRPDYITLSGSGEPTLFSRTGELIDGIKSMTNVPVAVLTNGSLLWQADVRQQLLGADLVIPSLDAGDSAMFRAVNRPHDGIAFDKMMDGLIAFRSEFPGQYWLEVFLLTGHTAVDHDAEKLAQCVSKIQPDRVHLNTVTRPPAEDFAYRVPQGRLLELAGLFKPCGEVVADFHGAFDEPEFVSGAADVLAMLQRRSCSLGDIANGLGMHPNEALKYVEELQADGLVCTVRSQGKSWFRATTRAGPTISPIKAGAKRP